MLSLLDKELILKPYDETKKRQYIRVYNKQYPGDQRKENCGSCGSEVYNRLNYDLNKKEMPEEVKKEEKRKWRVKPMYGKSIKNIRIGEYRKAFDLSKITDEEIDMIANEYKDHKQFKEIMIEFEEVK